MTTYQELIAQRAELNKQQAELEKQIAESLKAERAVVIAQIKTLLADHGLTVADLTSRVGRPPKESSSDTAETVTRKVAPKYHDVTTGDTWTGRGLKPKWLATALENGRKLEEFLISRPE